MFIYVMDSESKDKMISLGYTLLKEHENKSIWVFAGNGDFKFEATDIPCVVSDILTF